MKLKIITIGDSAGVLLPKELLACMHWEIGEELFATELSDGIKLTTYAKEFARQMEIAEKVMRKERNLLRKLADS